MEAQALEFFIQLGRMNGGRGEVPVGGEGISFFLIEVGHHGAVDRLRRVAGPPGDHIAAVPLLVEDVPDGLDLSARHIHRLQFAAFSIEFNESVDPMLPGPFARGNGGPQHRGEHGLQGGQVAVYAFAQKFLERGHLPLRHERFDDLPVGGVPADQQNFGPLGQALRFLALFSSASFSFFRACAFFFTASQSLGNSSRQISTARYPKASTAKAPGAPKERMCSRSDPSSDPVVFFSSSKVV